MTTESLIRHYSTRRDARTAGRSIREITPRRELGNLTPTKRDPVAHLMEQNADRVQDLVPLRMARMLENPFAFYRGTAGLMAVDLSDDANSGILVVACGDAHISNFGFYASPERRLVFDLNDFDEAAAAPWEWDVKRLVTSAIIGGRHAGYDEALVEDTAREAVHSYTFTLDKLSRVSPVDRYFMHSGGPYARNKLDKAAQQALDDAVKAAERRTAQRAIRRTTERGPDGRLRFVENPPTMTHLEQETVESLEALVDRYRSTVNVDIQLVISQYQPLDLVQRVVGVGSVGTRCFLHLMAGADDDLLLLQVKEANESVLVKYGKVEQPPRIAEGIATQGNGLRVVALQRILQGVSDPYLGYLRTNDRDYYLRQFHDMKGSIELEGLDAGAYRAYVAACASLLARAHAQSPTAIEIVGYIGKSDAAADAITRWSYAYADQSLRDYNKLRVAADEGRVPVAELAARA
jgi:uncharacterized protein (DUF2252 family)